MTEKELSLFDGREGRRAYAAVNGKIYDFTDSPRWKDGHHEMRHRAGCDLSRELEGAPHVRAVIERFPVVGTLEEKSSSHMGKGPKILAITIIVLFLLLVVLILLK